MDLKGIYEKNKKFAISLIKDNMVYSGMRYTKKAYIAKMLLENDNPELDRIGRENIYELIVNCTFCDLLWTENVNNFNRDHFIDLSENLYLGISPFNNKEFKDKEKINITEIATVSESIIKLKNGKKIIFECC